MEDALILQAFAEDFVCEDLTSIACIAEGVRARAQIVLKQRGCAAGLKWIERIFQLRDPGLKVEVLAEDGKVYEKGTVLAEVEGPAHSLLSAERVAVNFLQHLCGVATLTAKCVEKVKGTKCQILDTRKTILGLRSLQKYAVRMGGGTNHRLHLADQILIKNNHLALNDMVSCIRKAKIAYPKRRIEVEIDSPADFIPAVEAGADAILLDNMTPQQVGECVQCNQKKVYLEASGGITLETLSAYAATGVDGISIGALTHSAPALDISLRVEKLK